MLSNAQSGRKGLGASREDDLCTWVGSRMATEARASPAVGIKALGTSIWSYWQSGIVLVSTAKYQQSGTHEGSQQMMKMRTTLRQ